MADTTPGAAGRQVRSGDLTVRKAPDSGSYPVPALELTVASDYEVPVAVRVVDTLPDGLDADRVGVPAADREHWSLEAGAIAWSGRVAPGEERTVVYGALPAGIEQARGLLGRPEIDAVHPTAGPTDAPPQWRRATRTILERTLGAIARETPAETVAAGRAVFSQAATGGAADDGAATRAAGVEGAPAADAAEEPVDEGADDADVAAAVDDASADDIDEALVVGAPADDPNDDLVRVTVRFAADAAPDARERALRDFAAFADLREATPALSRVVEGAVDAVEIAVADAAPGDLEAALHACDAVAGAAASGGGTGADAAPDDAFGRLKREYDQVDSEELERELDRVGGPLLDDEMTIAELLAGAAEPGGTATTDGATEGHGKAAADDESVPAAATGSPPAAASESTPDGGREAAGSAGPDGDLVAALRAALEAADDEQTAALRSALGVPSRRRADARAAALRDRVGRLDAYVDALEEFIDEHGTARQLVQDYRTRTRRLETRVEALADDAGEARLGRADLRAEVEGLADAVDDISRRVEAIEEMHRGSVSLPDLHGGE